MSIRLGTQEVQEYLNITSLEGAELSNYYTKTEVDGLISNIDVSGQLKNYALKTELPTKTSQLTNDSGFLTQHQSLAGYAKETYVDQRVADLVKSAPQVLDTLEELSDALGNDPNFATTITAEIGKKANSNDVYTKSDINATISNYYTKVQIEDKNYATKLYVQEYVSQELGDIDSLLDEIIGG